MGLLKVLSSKDLGSKMCERRNVGDYGTFQKLLECRGHGGIVRVVIPA